MAPTGNEQNSVRLAFWGYTNARGAKAVVVIARQFRTCEAMLDGHGELDSFFYDMPEPIDDIMESAMHGAGGPARHDGGWDDLVAVLGPVGPGIDSIICASIDRIGRKTRQSRLRHHLVANKGATILCANELSPSHPVATARRPDLWRRVDAVLGEHGYASAEMLVRTGRRGARG